MWKMVKKIFAELFYGGSPEGAMANVLNYDVIVQHIGTLVALLYSLLTCILGKGMNPLSPLL